MKKAAINIRDISPWLNYHLGEAEEDSTNYEEYNKLICKNADKLGLYRKYLTQLHDSYIISTVITENKFSITLDEHATGCFAWEIVDKNNLNIKPKSLVFPMRIDFETTDISFNKVNAKGYIKKIEPVKIDEYLYNHILNADKEKIEIALIVWRNGTKKNERGEHILILMTVKNILVQEKQDQAWVELFGSTYDDYYKFFKTQLAAGRYLSESWICDVLYKEAQAKFKA